MIPGEDAALEIIREGHPDVYEKPIWLINSKGGCIVCIPLFKAVVFEISKRNR